MAQFGVSDARKQFLFIKSGASFLVYLWCSPRLTRGSEEILGFRLHAGGSIDPNLQEPRLCRR
jgi:hypothetical protein